MSQSQSLMHACCMHHNHFNRTFQLNFNSFFFSRFYYIVASLLHELVHLYFAFRHEPFFYRLLFRLKFERSKTVSNIRNDAVSIRIEVNELREWANVKLCMTKKKYIFNVHLCVVCLCARAVVPPHEHPMLSDEETKRHRRRLASRKVISHTVLNKTKRKCIHSNIPQSYACMCRNERWNNKINQKHQWP